MTDLLSAVEQSRAEDESPVILPANMLYATIVALRESAGVHEAERIPFGPELIALAEHLETLLPAVAELKR